MAGNNVVNTGVAVLTSPPAAYDANYMQNLVATLNRTLSQYNSALAKTTSGGGIFSGPSAPGVNIGSQGDFYLQFSSPAVLWGPLKGTWTSSSQTVLS